MTPDPAPCPCPPGAGHRCRPSFVAVEDWPTTSSYAWVIDRDYLAEEWDDPEPSSNVGVSGPHDAPDDLAALLRDGYGFEFRIRDGDGILYYSGRIVFADNGTVATADETEAFGPLTDYGTPNDGATTIEYLTAGMWVAL